MSNYEFPSKPLLIRSIISKTLSSYVENFPAIFISGIAVFFVYRYFFLIPDFKTLQNSFLEFVKTSPFFDGLNAYRALQIFTASMSQESPLAVFLQTYWQILAFALIIQPFAFGSVTLAAGRAYRVGKLSIRNAALDLSGKYFRFLKLSFTEIYLGSIVAFTLGGLVLICVYVFSAVTRTPDVFSLASAIVTGICFVFMFFFVCLAYAVSAFEGKLAFRALGRSIVLIKANLWKSAVIMAIFIFVPACLLAAMFFDPGTVIPFYKSLLMLVASAVLMPFMFIAPVHLFSALKVQNEMRIQQQIDGSQTVDANCRVNNSDREGLK